MYSTSTSLSLAAIPLFVLLGELLFRSGSVKILFDAVDGLVGNVGAGSKLALLVTVGAAAYFAFLLAFARPIVEEVLGLFRPKREAAA